MYVYQITNLKNQKKYIGITNNYVKRWQNHLCNNDPSMIIAKAIKKYGKDSFKFEVLYSGLSIEEASLKEVELIKNLQTLTPFGYNVAKGDMYNMDAKPLEGADNGRALLSNEEAQYIKNHRDQPMYVLYEKFNQKISYDTFKKCYKHQTYKNLIPSVEEYPYNREFSLQFSFSSRHQEGLEYNEVIDIRNRYANGEYWKNVYQDYKDKYSSEQSFWNAYNGKTYKLVMPEVFTLENRHKHSSLKNMGINNGRSKLTEEQVLDIRKKHKEGISNKELYNLYPQVSPTSIKNIINGKTWKFLL